MPTLRHLAKERFDAIGVPLNPVFNAPSTLLSSSCLTGDFSSFIGTFVPFDHTKIDETAPLPKVFQAADEWSEHIQAVSAQISLPGSHLAVDECMIRYTGRSNETTLAKGKPDPLRFKIWVIAQQGFFIRWLWHIKDAKYGAVGVELPPPTSSTRGRATAARKMPAIEDKPIALNSTQSVVVALANMLPKATYHVFVDNLFSSSDLFRCLRKHGHEATGTARPNCGIDKELQQDKKADGGFKTSYEFNQVKVTPTPDNQKRMWTFLRQLT
ncbi:hypothetical protein HZS61_002478 [Fusarium oxysporum f. sp. conglutinans]|uniref:PiggyBac transposable element-derived protein domain-containing protein n=1 Tax=Fusarium oxysporum f. sp. conglutinans TaxID=100902 RepID=A0A8H6GJF6_FUSOX|nr:hypothetical protein HZS61_002478 [Fusarium oxysporum f. sp. conglutinans]